MSSQHCHRSVFSIFHLSPFPTPIEPASFAPRRPLLGATPLPPKQAPPSHPHFLVQSPSTISLQILHFHHYPHFRLFAAVNCSSLTSTTAVTLRAPSLCLQLAGFTLRYSFVPFLTAHLFVVNRHLKYSEQGRFVAIRPCYQAFYVA